MWPNYKSLRIDSLIHMSDEAAPPPAPLCLDDLMDSALDVLELGRVRILLSKKISKKCSTIANSDLQFIKVPNLS
jgi:hypothetical protein